jgi:hypothetical protein
MVCSQTTGAKCLDIGVACGRPLAADPLGELEKVTGADRDLQELLQIRTGVSERRGLPRVTHGLTQDHRAVPPGTQVQFVVQGEKDDPAGRTPPPGATESHFSSQGREPPLGHWGKDFFVNRVDPRYNP